MLPAAKPPRALRPGRARTPVCNARRRQLRRIMKIQLERPRTLVGCAGACYHCVYNIQLREVPIK